MKAIIETDDSCVDYIDLCESNPTRFAGAAIVVDLTDEQVQLVREFEATRKRYNEMVHRVKLTDDLLRFLVDFRCHELAKDHAEVNVNKCWRLLEFKLVDIAPRYSPIKRVDSTDLGKSTCAAMLEVASQYTGTKVEGNELEMVKLLDDPDVGPHMLEAGRAKALEVAA